MNQNLPAKVFKQKRADNINVATLIKTIDLRYRMRYILPYPFLKNLRLGSNWKSLSLNFSSDLPLRFVKTLYR